MHRAYNRSMFFIISRPPTVNRYVGNRERQRVENVEFVEVSRLPRRRRTRVIGSVVFRVTFHNHFSQVIPTVTPVVVKHLRVLTNPAALLTFSPLAFAHI